MPRIKFTSTNGKRTILIILLIIFFSVTTIFFPFLLIYFLPQSVINNSLEASNSWSWDINSKLVLPTGTLSSEKVCGKGLASKFSHKSLVVKAREGGERCKPFGRSKSQKLKKLFQEYKVPPWLRNRLPLIFVKDEIAAVADLWVCEKFKTEEDKFGFLLKWSDNLELNS